MNFVRPNEWFAGAFVLAISLCAPLDVPAVQTHEGHDEAALHGTPAIAAPEVQEGIVAHALPNGLLQPGKSTRVVLHVTTSEGNPVAAKDIVPTHGEMIHLLSLDPSLTDYQHLHPRATGEPGFFEFDFEPRKGGEYALFAEMQTAGSSSPAIARTTVRVEGPAETPRDALFADSESDGYRFRIAGADGATIAVGANTLELTVTDADGNPPRNMEPIMEAMAHLVGFDAERKHLAHFHPLGEMVVPLDGKLRFHAEFASPGVYRLFSQVKIDGREIVSPFVLSIMDAGNSEPIEVGNKLCPITGKPVGSMDPDARVTVRNHIIGLCCQPCAEMVLLNPDDALAKAKASRSMVNTRALD